MARNSEKAMTALARWRQLQLKEQGKLVKARRPYLASEENNLRRAEKWRNEVIREIAKKVTQIQNAGLGEYKIRDLNDEINKLLNEKRHWEERIGELGGTPNSKSGLRMLDHEGKEVSSDRGYKYFGAAKDLPGVRELFEQDPPPPPRKSRGDLMKRVDAEYYGYLNEEDSFLTETERKCELEAIERKVKEWESRYGEPVKDQSKSEDKEQSSFLDLEQSEDLHKVGIEAFDTSLLGRKGFFAHVETPSRDEMEKLVTKKLKEELTKKYVSDDLVTQEQESKELLGRSNDKQP